MVVRAFVVALAALALAACGGGGEPDEGAAPAASGELRDLSSVLDLRAAFNDDAGRPRLLVLLSPT